MLELRRQAASTEKESAHDPSSAATPSQRSRRTPSSRSNSSLPPELHDAVPSCARQCLESYINSSWRCPDDGASCLCSRYSDQGYTLGELAYICLWENCDAVTLARKQTAYNICSTSPRRVSPTHKTLTPLPTTATRQVSSTRTPGETTTTREHSTGSSSQHSSATSATLATHTRRPAAAATMTSSPASSASLPPAAAMSQLGSSTQKSTNLTHAEAAGISVAAMGAIMLAIAIVYLIIWMRRRKVRVKDERKSYDFVDEAPPRFSPFNYGHADPRGPLGGFEKRRAELGSDKHLTRWPGVRMSYDEYVHRYLEKSVSITPPEKRGSDESERDLPHQLPTNPPMSKPLPAQLRGLPKSPAPSAYTTDTMFEEDRPPVPNLTGVPARKPLPKAPLGIAIHYPPPPPPKPFKSNQPYVGDSVRSPQRSAQPALSLAIPKQATRVPGLTPIPDFPLPPAPLNIGSKNNKSAAPVSALSEDPRDSTASVLEYYASPQAAGYETSPDIDLPTPVQVAARKRRDPPGFAYAKKSAISRPIPQGPKPSRMNSIGSDTSFESLDEDEPTPPEEDKQLTPVQESQPSPLAGIRYPKVPRSSNQAVPRSPKPTASPRAQATLFPLATKGTLQRPKPPPKDLDGRTPLSNNSRPFKQNEDMKPRPPVTPVRNNTSTSTTSTLSGTTLAAKRRGDNAAQDLERRFFVAKSAHEKVDSHITSKSSEKSDLGPMQNRPYAKVDAQNSPLKGYGRVANSPGGYSSSQGRIVRPGVNAPPAGQGMRYYGLPANPREAVKERSGQDERQWEPKLTPSRRGEDLYLSVGVATPRTDYFQR